MDEIGKISKVKESGAKKYARLYLDYSDWGSVSLSITVSLKLIYRVL